MEDQFFNLDDLMIDYSEMTSFDFGSSEFLLAQAGKEVPDEYKKKPFTFKYGNFDVIDMLQSIFSKGENYAKSL